ncbi:CTP synthase 1-like [Crassostrea angulata]|uniref:CTP synthase 1 n=1 Tax=Magallana gigas TaxID=29159 RepID=UPI0022B0E2B5|nr:CTP synthase 1-like [Crassostrea angulata]XP_052710490.1 CTP synthase 1-like [Crassostrea angulata]XP_052710491.1 CTP synthase 1-like [Crassostrea angulata]
MKYVLVSGGVISGIGKGVIASSLGMILKSCGIRVTSIKIDPYINIDAGTFSPYEHGEVFVLDDGGEVDLDLGNYERFLDITLHRDNNITTGKIYQHVINRERRGDYLGKTVQVVPHITDAVQEWVERVAKIPVDGDNKIPEVCIVELGGTIGDIEGMPFIEAFRQFFHFRVKREDYCCVHVSLVPQPGSTGEQKTKPTQQSVRELRGLGLSPDIIVCRCQTPVAESVKSKISLFCHVEPQQVFSIHDVSSIYRVPLLLTEQGVSEYLMKRLNLNHPSPHNNRWMLRWKDLASRHDQLLREVTIALVGKYTQLEDAYASVIKALQHSALCVSHRLNLRYIEAADLELEKLKENPSKYHEAWHQLVSANGILVPGGFGIRGTEGKILAANWARTKNVPYLGVCLGLQCAVIEFARNALSMEGANSTELDSATKYPVVIDMPEHNTGQMGGTMRLGKRKTVFNAKTCITKKLYGNKDYVEERHRHRYEVNPKFIQKFEDAGMKFVGRSTDGERMEIMELEGHQYFVGVQYHPEYISRPMKPSPPYLGLLLAATGKMQAYRSRGYRMSPHLSYSEGNEEDDEELAEIVRNISTEDVQEASSKDSSPNEES